MSLETNPQSINWYKSLNINQKIGLKEVADSICGMKWEDFNILFTPRERIDILYTKLKMEGIIPQEN